QSSPLGLRGEPTKASALDGSLLKLTQLSCLRCLEVAVSQSESAPKIINWERTSQTPYNNCLHSPGVTHSKIRERRRLSPSYCNQFVNSKFGRRLDDLCVFGQVRNEFWIRLRPPKSIPGENKMRGSSAPQPLKILDCLLAVVWSAVVNRVVLGKMPALALGVVKGGRIAHVRGYDQRIGRCHSFQLQTRIAKLRRR